MSYKCRTHLLQYMAAFLACVFFASCSQDELADNGQGTLLPIGQYPLELTAANLNESVATPAKAATRGTVDGNWEGARSVAVRVNGKVKEYVVDSYTAGSAKLTCPDITEADTDFWWTKNGEKKAVDAWYPYYDTLPTEWPIENTQTAETLAAQDLMYGCALDMTQTNPTIKFKHQLAKVEINLVNSDYLKSASEVNVSLDGQYKTGELEVYPNGTSYFHGKFGEASNSTIIPCKLSSPNHDYYASYQALVIPLDMEAAKKSNLNVIVDGVTYRCKLKNHSGYVIHLQSGYLYTFNITVKEHGLDVKVSESIGWGEGNTGNGEVELP